MDNKLRKYALDQKKKGVHPGYLKYKLERAGWSKKDVDNLVEEVYSTKKAVKILLIVVFIFFIGLILLVLFLLKKPAVYIIHDNNTDNVNLSTVNISCVNIFGVDLKKDACYFNEIKNGFDCSRLNNIFEKTFCYRALDVFVLSVN